MFPVYLMEFTCEGMVRQPIVYREVCKILNDYLELLLKSKIMVTFNENPVKIQEKYQYKRLIVRRYLVY